MADFMQAMLVSLVATAVVMLSLVGIVEVMGDTESGARWLEKGLVGWAGVVRR